MPEHLPTAQATRPAPRSLVLLQPTGPLVTAALLLGTVLLAANALKLASAAAPWRNATGGLLGLVLLLSAGYRAVRGNRPRLLTIGRDSLQLEQPDRQPAETIPLNSIMAYTYWLRLLKSRGFAQYHLRLELADGRVLHLADRPSIRPDDPTGTVRLNVLAKRLARRTGPQRRQLFFETQTARVLLWSSWAALAASLALLWRGQPEGLLLLFPALGYWASYYLGRGSAELTE